MRLDISRLMLSRCGRKRRIRLDFRCFRIWDRLVDLVEVGVVVVVGFLEVVRMGRREEGDMRVRLYRRMRDRVGVLDREVRWMVVVVVVVVVRVGAVSGIRRVIG